MSTIYKENGREVQCFSPLKKIAPELDDTYKKLNKCIEDCEFGYEEVLDEIIYKIRANKHNLPKSREKYIPLIEYCACNEDDIDINFSYCLGKIVTEHIRYNDLDFLKHYLPKLKTDYKFNPAELILAMDNDADVELFEHIIDNYDRSLTVDHWSYICSSKNLNYMNIVKRKRNKNIYNVELQCMEKLITDDVFYSYIRSYLSSIAATNFFLDSALEESYKLEIIGPIENCSVACQLIFRHIQVCNNSRYYGFQLTDDDKKRVIKSLEGRYEKLRGIIYSTESLLPLLPSLPLCLANLIASFIIVPRDEIIKILNNEYDDGSALPYAM